MFSVLLMLAVAVGCAPATPTTGCRSDASWTTSETTDVAVIPAVGETVLGLPAARLANCRIAARSAAVSLAGADPAELVGEADAAAKPAVGETAASFAGVGDAATGPPGPL